jgi:hypothetical protein
MYFFNKVSGICLRSKRKVSKYKEKCRENIIECYNKADSKNSIIDKVEFRVNKKDGDNNSNKCGNKNGRKLFL